MSPSCTEYERIALTAALNFSDAHACQPLSRAQRHIVKNFPLLFEQAQHREYTSLAADFLKCFFCLARQTPPLPPEQILLSYSASCATDMVSLFCKERKYTVGLIEPCFDNISSFLFRRGVTLVPLHEDDVLIHADPGEQSIDVLWLVSPNNPTGACLTEEAFRLLARRCKERGIIIVADFCFRFFSECALSFDQYEIFADEGASFIAIEDTGKTWPTSDIKCGITTASSDCLDDIYARHDDLLLNLSPFVLLVLSSFLQDSIDNGLGETVRRISSLNRSTLLDHLAPFTWLRDCGVSPTFPLLWLEIHGRRSGEELYESFKSNGIHVLPGLNFFWHRRQEGRRFLRMALNRDPQLVDCAASRIATCLNSFS